MLRRRRWPLVRRRRVQSLLGIIACRSMGSGAERKGRRALGVGMGTARRAPGEALVRAYPGLGWGGRRGEAIEFILE